MKGVPAIYLGRIVDKKHFRAFIYAPNNQSKLIENWNDFESHMQTGLWFATEDEASPKPVAKQKSEKKHKDKEVEVNAVSEDDFLPKGIQ